MPDLRKLTLCDECNHSAWMVENDYGEFVCDDCQQNKAEAAWERHCEDFHDGGCTRFIRIEQQQEAARRLK